MSLREAEVMDAPVVDSVELLLLLLLLGEEADEDELEVEDDDEVSASTCFPLGVTTKIIFVDARRY